KVEAADPPKLLVRDAVPLEEAEGRFASRLSVAVTAEEASRDRLLALRGALARFPGDCPVTLTLRIPGESETVIALPDRWGVDPSDELLRELDALFGRRVAEV